MKNLNELNKEYDMSVSDTEKYRTLIFITVIFISIVFLAGCGDAHDQYACYMSVKEKFPNSEVTRIPDANYKFIVKKEDGSLFYVETMNSFNDNVSKTEKVKFQ